MCSFSWHCIIIMEGGFFIGGRYAKVRGINLSRRGAYYNMAKTLFLTFFLQILLLGTIEAAYRHDTQ